MKNRIRSIPSRRPAQGGNALLLTLGVLVMAFSIVATSTTVSMGTFKETVSQSDKQAALAAVNMVIARRELRLVQLGLTGDPQRFVDFTDNFGVDQVGGTTVRWKVSPAHTAVKDQAGRDQDYIVNPPPVDSTLGSNAHQLSNDVIFLYEVAATGEVVQGGEIVAKAEGVRYTGINKTPLFRYVIFYAQRGPRGDLELSHSNSIDIKGSVHTNGALYIGSATKVNDWATLAGPPGYTHIGPATVGTDNTVPVRVIGVDGIFCLSKPLLYGVMNNVPLATTVLAQTGMPADFYDTDATVRYPRDAEAIQSFYRLINDPVVLGNTNPLLVQNLAGISSNTQVDYVNPYRVRNYGTASLATRNTSYSGSASGQVTARTINQVAPGGAGVPILGIDTGTCLANDSRDGSYANATGRWQQYSTGSGAFNTGKPQGFNGQARTSITGGSVKQLPANLIGVEGAALRPLESQALRYLSHSPTQTTGHPYDDDPNSDDHEWATPLFRIGSAPDATTTDPASFWTAKHILVEEPGKYMRHALGEGRYLARRSETSTDLLASPPTPNAGTGWDVVAFNGDTPAPINTLATTLGKVGLVIRERPVPATDIWPGNASCPPLPMSDPNALPFAYGKAFRPSKPKITPIDVDSGTWPAALYGAWWGAFGIGNNSVNNNMINEASGGPAAPSRSFSLDLDGTLTVTSQAIPGAYFPKGTNLSEQVDSQGNPLPGRDVMREGNRERYTYFYNDSWRFFHLKQPKPTLANGSFTNGGITWRTFDDGVPRSTEMQKRYWFDNGVGWNNVNNKSVWDIVSSAAVLTGKPWSVTTNGAWPTVPNSGQYFSWRLEGFLVPQFSESYFIGAKHDDGLRVWFDGKLLSDVSRFTNAGVSVPYGGYTERLSAGKAYPVVMELYQGVGGYGIESWWSSPSCPAQVIPAATAGSPIGWHRTDPNYGFKKPGGAVNATTGFKAIQGRISVASLASVSDRNVPANSLHKVGLMLRDGAAGLSPWLSGRDAYVMIGYNRIRGVFVQYRTAAAETWYGEAKTPRWFVGAKTDSANSAGFVERNATTNALTRTNIPYGSDGRQNSFDHFSPPGLTPALVKGEIDSLIIPAVGAQGPLSINGTNYKYENFTLTSTLEFVSNNPTDPWIGNYYNYWDRPRQDLLAVQVESWSAGDGTARSVKVAKNGGTLTTTVRPRKADITYVSNSVTLKLTNCDTDARLVSQDSGRPLYLNNSLTPTTFTSVDETNQTITIGANPNNSGWQYNPVNVANDISRTITIPDHVVFIANNQIPGMTAAQVVNEMNASAVDGITDWQVIPTGISYNWNWNSTYVYANDPDTSTFNWSVIDYPPLANPLPAKPVNIGPGAYVFAIDRSPIRYDVYQDFNNWVSRTGQWSDNLIKQVVPWNKNWTSQTFNPAQAALKLLTHSHRPDLFGASETLADYPPLTVFNGTQAVTPYPTPASPPLLNPLIPAGLTGSLGTNVANYWQLTDDIPSKTEVQNYDNAPLGTPMPDPVKLVRAPDLQSVWLRIEQDPKFPTKIRFAWSPRENEPGSGDWYYVKKNNSPTSLYPHSVQNTSTNIIDGSPPYDDILRVDLSDITNADPKQNWGGQTDPSLPKDQILAGPCFQNSGIDGSSVPFTAVMDQMKVLLNAGEVDSADLNPTAAGDKVIDKDDWFSDDSSGGGAMASRYLASQYQVLWGPYDITEDFFTWNEAKGNAGRTAWEDMMFSPREFWSQSRRWFDAPKRVDNKYEKDKNSSGAYAHDNIANRLSLAKTTMLTLNLGKFSATDPLGTGIQGYLRNRRLVDAVQPRITNPGLANSQTGVSPQTSNPYTNRIAPSDRSLLLKDSFNGLIYAARTNRYPWNPTPRSSSGGVYAGRNLAAAWDLDSAESTFPNTNPDLSGSNALLDAMDANLRRLGTGTIPNSLKKVIKGITYHKLQSYTTSEMPVAPAIRPQDFHHGVRIVNASDIHWGFANPGATGQNPAGNFGESKLSVVTPNQLYVCGDTNTKTYNLTVRNTAGTTAKYAPMAVMADVIHLLSNNFSAYNAQQPGKSYAIPGVYDIKNKDLTVTASGTSASVSGTNILVQPTQSLATDTTYNTCVLTHNLPTTRKSVLEGQGASFVDTLLLMEGWDQRTMKFMGSLVVMDTRRYTQAFLLDNDKKYGRTVFGTTIATGDQVQKSAGMSREQLPYLSGDAVAKWQTIYSGLGLTIEWNGFIPTGYASPTRIYSFNNDLLTPEGTPPFTPFGVTTSGVGGWLR